MPAFKLNFDISLAMQLLGLGSRQDDLPPRTPENNRLQYAPPSTGKSRPNRTQPLNRPSSEEGKREGLCHVVSDDGNMQMQCTSTPAAVELLKILEKAVGDHEPLDEKFISAANYVLLARHLLMKDVGSNERFYIGAMANALNTILEDGYCVLHQACLGTGATHSDLSAVRINPKNDSERAWPVTLMVGEGKWQSRGNPREVTRGQILNELLRHRKLDEESSNEENHGPILLFAFDDQKVEVDLAFPSTKGGKLETDGVVEFSNDLVGGQETFWTLRILRISIEDVHGSRNLARVFRFIREALQKLDAWSYEQGRVQQKMPMSLTMQEQTGVVVQYCGENVTIIEEKSGSKFVYKEYCYHLRQDYDFNVMIPPISIKDEDKRQPPPKKLLEKLGPPYSDEWIVTEGPFGTSVLRYPFIEGNSYSPSVKGWLMILGQIQMMHEIDFIHGDLLPRNVLFADDGRGYVIDFDLSRKAGKSKYVAGYNYKDFQKFRHEGARAGKQMSKEHDLHSLRRMSLYFFDLGQSTELNTLDLDGLRNFFRERPSLNLGEDIVNEMNGEEATGSPNRALM